MKLVVHHLAPFKYIRTMNKKIKQIATSQLLTPDPTHATDPEDQIKSNSKEIS